MGAIFTPINGDIKIEMDWTATQEKVLLVVSNAAANLFYKGFGDHGTDEEPRTFDDLSNQEKLDLLYNHFGRVARDEAYTWISNEEQRMAREAVNPDDYQL